MIDLPIFGQCPYFRTPGNIRKTNFFQWLYSWNVGKKLVTACVVETNIEFINDEICNKFFFGGQITGKSVQALFSWP